MTNAINNLGNNMPFNLGEPPMAAQNGMEINASFRTAPMFPPDHAGGGVEGGAGRDAGGMRPLNAATQGLAGAALGGGVGGGIGGGNAAGGMSGVMSQIMNVVQGLMSAVMLVAPPLLGMFGSMMGGAAGQGGQGTGTV